MSEQKATFILASASPRRSEILRTLGLDFETIAPEFVEQQGEGEAPADFVTRAARGKVADVAERAAAGVVIGADTVVVIDGRPLGKPADDEHAREMLRSLSGRWHAVMTGLAVRDVGSGREAADHDKTLVRFRDLTDEEIAAYVATGEPLDKAGAYAIQGRGMLFVEEIAGSYHNVVGLPATLLQRLLKRIGVEL
ncbi:MAG: Maf family protein [Actinomycetota bacterium]|nr:Maf family protein [Actinomycetota bacterium]